MTERLGIVYTPVEVVDFILHSVNHLLQQEFNQTLGSPGVHIIDPFTGTGTFITRLIQSGLIAPEQLPHKYKNEIHANEIVLLAYYIACINIEAAYHGEVIDEYTPFEGICLTDTFQMYEKDDLISEQLVENSERRKRQKALDIRVIIGNPPYSVGQDSANDNNANIKYPDLDVKLRETYVSRSCAINKNSLYDSYIRAIRWASDRVGNSGIIGFVTNAGFIEANTADGMRKCLAEEFSSLYIFHLRGNQRTSGELSRKEGGKIFGSGSRAPIAVSLLVKNPDATEHGKIYFHDIGDYLTREQKLAKMEGFVSVGGVDDWKAITPDEHGDWLNQRDDRFDLFTSIGDKSKTGEISIFENYSRGVATGRDAWCSNYSHGSVVENMTRMVGFYCAEVSRVSKLLEGKGVKESLKVASNAASQNLKEISWTRSLLQDLSKSRKHEYDSKSERVAMFKPYNKSWLYFNRKLNDMVYQLPKLFPENGENLVICLSSKGGTVDFGCLVASAIPSLKVAGDGGTQCFPLYLYDEVTPSKADNSNQSGLFDTEEPETQYQRRDAITDEGLQHFLDAYPGEQINKEDIFYYVYGLLHSQTYRDRYADNLSKELPRIPCVKTSEGFWGFSKAGRELADIHLNYETVTLYKATVNEKGDKSDREAFYRVEKMKHPRMKNSEGKSVPDLSVVVYNPRITVSDIPVEAYDYVVNGKPAIEWVIERQCVKTDKKSQIVNDANDWANETMNNPRYPLDLLLRVIAVSLETNRIVAGLPVLDID